MNWVCMSVTLWLMTKVSDLPLYGNLLQSRIPRLSARAPGVTWWQEYITENVFI